LLFGRVGEPEVEHEEKESSDSDRLRLSCILVDGFEARLLRRMGERKNK
jgi:hypothetical protein